MKIAFISLMGGASWGGSESLWTKTAEAALSEDHSVLISVYRWPEIHPAIKELQKKGATVQLRDRYDKRAGLLRKSWLHYKNRFTYLNQEISSLLQWKPDYLIINQGDTFDLSVHHMHLYESIKQQNIRYSLICHSHSQYGEIPGPEIYPSAKEIFLKAHKVYFVSSRMHQITERRLCTRLNNACITWNPLNIESPEIISWPKANPIQMAMVGTLGYTKGHDTLFQCLSTDHWQTRNWNLNIYGTGYGLKYLQDLAGFYNIEKQINFFGFTEDLKSIWGGNHLLLVPSAGEGLPISLTEAMLCGRPAVVTDVGGNSEVITEGYSGFVAAAPSVKSFSNGLERAMAQEMNWETMGHNAFQFMLSRIQLKPWSTILQYITSKP